MKITRFPISVLKNPQPNNPMQHNSPNQPQWGNNSNSGVANGGRASSAGTVVPGGENEMTNLSSQIEAMKMQQHTLREQISQSERNLTAQHTVNSQFS